MWERRRWSGVRSVQNLGTVGGGVRVGRRGAVYVLWRGIRVGNISVADVRFGGVSVYTMEFVVDAGKGTL